MGESLASFLRPRLDPDNTDLPMMICPHCSMEITPLSQEFDSFLGKKIIPSIAHVCPKCYRVLGTCLNFSSELENAVRQVLLEVASHKKTSDTDSTIEVMI